MKQAVLKPISPKVDLAIRKTPGVCGGSACLGSTRIPVWLIVSFIKNGLGNEALLNSYPQLTSEHLALARDYYRQHPDEIERDIRE